MKSLIIFEREEEKLLSRRWRKYIKRRPISIAREKHGIAVLDARGRGNDDDVSIFSAFCRWSRCIGSNCWYRGRARSPETIAQQMRKKYFC